MLWDKYAFFFSFLQARHGLCNCRLGHGQDSLHESSICVKWASRIPPPVLSAASARASTSINNAVKHNPTSYLGRMLLSVCLTRVRRCIFTTLRNGVSNFLKPSDSWNQFSWKVYGPWRQRLFMRSASEWGGIWEVRKVVFSHSMGHGGGYHREKLSSFSHKLHGPAN